MIRLLFIFVLVVCVQTAGAQELLTLQQCLKMGIERNLSLKMSFNDSRKAQPNLSENRAKLLPQINAVANGNDNFTPTTSVTDGRAFGKSYNVTKTLQYNAAVGLQLQMPLYNQQLYTSIDVAKLMNNINRLSYYKAREDLIVQISKIYYLIQNTTEQISIINDNIRRFEELRAITRAFHENGMALEVDLKRVGVKLENLHVQVANAQAMLAEQYNMLKYVLDYPAEKELKVVEKEVESLDATVANGLNMNLYELQLLQEKEKLSAKQKKLIKDGYLPMLNLSANWMYTAFTDKFSNWWHAGESNHWYKSNGIGISLRIPVFDGFEKRSKLRKAQIVLENAKISYQNTLRNMQTQYMNAVNDVENNRRNYIKQRENYRLAEDIYGVTMDRYREGIVSMVEVLQDEMSMSDAQNNYLTAHYNYQVSNLAVLKLTGQLDTLLQKSM